MGARVARSSSERTAFALASFVVLVVTQATALALEADFVRGDADESGAVDVTDAVSVIRHVF